MLLCHSCYYMLDHFSGTKIFTIWKKRTKKRPSIEVRKSNWKKIKQWNGHILTHFGFYHWSAYRIFNSMLGKNSVANITLESLATLESS